MSSWIDHWWPALLAAFGMLFAGFRALRKVLRVADAILGYEDFEGHRVPGIAERVEQLEHEMQEMKRLLAIALAAQGVDPEQHQ